MKKAFVVFCLGIFLASVSSIFAYQLPSYKTLCKELKDLPGWQAEQCEGMNMSGSPMGEMASAHRSYSKGNQRIEATIVCGMQAMGYWAPFAYKMQVETDKDFVKVTEVNGYGVGINYDKQTKTGSIIVRLTRGKKETKAVFLLNFENMSWQEALEIAKKFDWGAMEKLLR